MQVNSPPSVRGMVVRPGGYIKKFNFKNIPPAHYVRHLPCQREVVINLSNNTLSNALTNHIKISRSSKNKQ